MNNFIYSLNIVAPLFILMSIGYFSKQVKIVNEKFLHQLNLFVFNFCLPIMLFQNIRLSYKIDFSNLRLLFITIGGIICTILLSVLIVPLFIKKKGQKGSIIQGIYRSNALIYGFPIVEKMYGKTTQMNISILMSAVIFIYNIAAIIILAIHSEDEKYKITSKNIIQNIFSNPLIISSIIGMLSGISHLTFPKIFETVIEQLARIAIPLTLFIIGGDFKIKNLQHNITKVITITILRLIIIPIIILIICIYYWGLKNEELGVILGVFATPTAVSSYIMAKNMSNDYEIAGQIVVLTTAFSCFTIFLFIYFLCTYGYIKII